jgi:hypothetical protein
MKMIVLLSLFSFSAIAGTPTIDEKQIKLQIGSEAIIESFMLKEKAEEIDLTFRCSHSAKKKKMKCFMFDQKILK